MSDELLRALSAAVVVGPQDKLVMIVRNCDRKRFDEFVATFKERNGDLEGRVFIVAGDVELAVLRGDSPKPPPADQSWIKMDNG